MASPKYQSLEQLETSSDDAYERRRKLDRASYNKKWTVSTRTINVTFGLALLIAWFALSGKWNYAEIKETNVMAGYSALYGILIGILVDGFVLYEVPFEVGTGPEYQGSTKRSNIGDWILYLLQVRALYYFLRYKGKPAMPSTTSFSSF